MNKNITILQEIQYLVVLQWRFPRNQEILFCIEQIQPVATLPIPPQKKTKVVGGMSKLIIMEFQYPRDFK